MDGAPIVGIDQVFLGKILQLCGTLLKSEYLTELKDRHHHFILIGNGAVRALIAVCQNHSPLCGFPQLHALHLAVVSQLGKRRPGRFIGGILVGVILFLVLHQGDGGVGSVHGSQRLSAIAP